MTKSANAGKIAAGLNQSHAQITRLNTAQSSGGEGIRSDDTLKTNRITQIISYQSAGKHSGIVRVNGLIGGQRHHHHGRVRLQHAIKRVDFRTIQRGGGVKNAVGGEIGIAGHRTKPRIMLDGVANTRIRHALNERLGVVGITGRVQSKITIQRSDGVIRGAIHRHRADHRRQIDIDASRLKLGTPYGRRLTKLIGRHRSLISGGRNLVETRALKMLHQTTFLIGGHQQLIIVRRIRLQCGCGCGDPVRSRIPVADDQHRTDMLVHDEILQ